MEVYWLHSAFDGGKNMSLSIQSRERCVLAQPWSVTNRPSSMDDILMSITCGWSELDRCWCLIGNVFYADLGNGVAAGTSRDEQLSANVPDGQKILVPGEVFIDLMGAWKRGSDYLLSKGILSKTGKTFRSNHIEYSACRFHKDKCAPRFKCDQCNMLADSSQAYYDEKIGGTRCLKCEAILSGDIDVESAMKMKGLEMINKIDDLDF